MRPLVTFLIGLGAVVAAAIPGERMHAHQRGQPAPRLTVDSDTKLLVIAPHPDDEVLGAGGLMQRVRAAGGTVHVVYLTDGDGFPEGVRAEDHIESPRPADYRGYGRQRRREARAALAALQLGSYTHTFLSFPDGGLCQLIRAYWSDRRAAFRSPYTRLNRPPKAEILLPNTEYRGEDLTQELASIIGDLRPTLIVLPRKEDQHPDHCAAWFFVADALGDVERVHPDYSPDVVNYIVHFFAWPFEDARRTLGPPPGLRGGVSGWMSVPLTVRQQQNKHAALEKYETQVRVMDWFLNAFARPNEVFSRPAPSHVVLPLRFNPCCH
jgi:LmbE family N-acetylglucosaminyl deacetylase